jgi:enoyl-CoA hydratase/carnithine racemase
MHLDMWLALEDACRSLDPDTRLLVVRGVGSHFCAGADLRSVGDRPGISYAESNRRAELALASVPIPTVAFISGSCVGGGVQIAAACDLRISDTTARFGITPAKFGIVYPPSATESLVRLVGPARTKRLLYSADLIDAAEALRIGLVDEIHEPNEAGEHLAAFAKRLATRSLFTQAASKQMIDAIAATGTIPRPIIEHWQNESASSPDAHEGISAFLDKRAPNFTWTPRPRRVDAPETPETEP